MKNWIKNNLISFLIVVGIISLFISIALYAFWIKKDGNNELVTPFNDFLQELAKSFLALSFTAIAGGIAKVVYEEIQDKKKEAEKEKEEARIKAEKEKEEKIAKQEKIKDFKHSVLDQLRNVFDDVDSARLIIEAHKSAKTYSEKVQEKIIPSIVTLFDIKRSLVDSHDMLEEKNLLRLRLNIHYMIAYLQVLANEYRDKYPPISYKQSHQEKIKEVAIVDFINKLKANHKDDFFKDDILKTKTLPPSPEWVWDSIKELTHMGLFIEDEKGKYNISYRKMFVDFYEINKKILKDLPIGKKNEILYENVGKPKEELEQMAEEQAEKEHKAKKDAKEEYDIKEEKAQDQDEKEQAKKEYVAKAQANFQWHSSVTIALHMNEMLEIDKRNSEEENNKDDNSIIIGLVTQLVQYIETKTNAYKTI